MNPGMGGEMEKHSPRPLIQRLRAALFGMLLAIRTHAGQSPAMPGDLFV
jgi:hypothetical protein